MAHPVRATYRVQLTPDLRPRPGRGDGAVPGPARRQPPLHLARWPRPRPAAPTATTSSTTGGCAPSSAASRPCAGCGRRSTPTGWATSSTSCPTTWASATPRTGGGRTCSATAGRAAFADHFDIDWEPPDPGSTGKVVLPFLDRPLDEAVRDGALRVERGTDPLDLVVAPPRRPVARLGGVAGRCSTSAPATAPSGSTACSTTSTARPRRWRGSSPPSTGGPSTGARPARLLNWRRFFDVTDLAAVRVERPEVFDDVHALLRSWLADDLGGRVVQGVRVDHVDGLVDPQGYLDRLRDAGRSRPAAGGREDPGRRRAAARRPGRSTAPPATRSWPGSTRPSPTRRAPPSWPGSSHRRHRGRRVVARARAASAGAWWPTGSCAPRSTGWPRAVAAAAGRRRRHGAAPDGAVRAGRRPSWPSHLGVYRTYARPRPTSLSGADRVELDRAAAELAPQRPRSSTDVLDDVARHCWPASAATGPAADEVVDPLRPAHRARWRPRPSRTPPSTARSSLPVAHRGRRRPRAARRAARRGARRLRRARSDGWPGTLVPLTTHDTKRSGDVRARLSRLAADPSGTSRPFAALARGSPSAHRSPAGPDPAVEWLLWTSLVGAWPIDADRLAAFATKAVREAKAHTSWIDPDPAYEDAVRALRPRRDRPTRPSRAVVDRVRRHAARRRPGRVARPGHPRLHRRRHPRPLPGRRGLEPLARRPRQPPPDRPPTTSPRCSTGRPTPVSTWPRLWARSADDPDDDGLVKMATWHRLLRLRAARPGRLRGTGHEPAPGRRPRPRRPCSPSPGRRRGVGVVVRRAARTAADGMVELPPGPGTTCSPGSSTPGGTDSRARRRSSTGSRWRCWRRA